MIESILYAILAILGLGFLVCIHELGHFWVARRQGMRVEAFSIGFGKAIYSWERNGVIWQIGSLPFGGYVKIAGMQKEGSREPYEITDGFFGKKPWARIKVALAGPLVNIFFALLVFTFIWALGGREKQFSEFTHRIGWVDPKSALYEKGVRPGDVIVQYDGREFNGFRDLLVAAVMGDDTMQIAGYKVDYATGGQKTDFDYTLKTYLDPRSGKDKLSTIGVLVPAQYLIYEPSMPLMEGSPMKDSGLQPRDRIVWANGEVVFSAKQLSTLINESSTFLTVQRGGQIFHTKVPRVSLDDLRMSFVEKAEIDDWQHETGLKGRLQDLAFIPYNLSPDCVVESRLSFIDELDQAKAFEPCQRCASFKPLQEGDKILAIDGAPVHNAYQFLQAIQTRKVLIIVDRDLDLVNTVLWTKADGQFDDFGIQGLDQMVASLGTDAPKNSVGTLQLLKPIQPLSYADIPLPAQQKIRMAEEMAVVRKEIDAISDPQKRNEQLREFERSQNRLVLGIPLKDRDVRYNPNPLQQFASVFQDTWRTLSGLFSGALNPKYVSGPVGIIHVVHNSWMVGAKEALFWMAVISLNLGLINLLPIPVLDGGHIMFSLLESVTRKPLRSKTMERLVIPFVALLICLFIYITYQDIARLFSKFF